VRIKGGDKFELSKFEFLTYGEVYLYRGGDKL